MPNSAFLIDFYKCWTAAVGSPKYRKTDWQDLESVAILVDEYGGKHTKEVIKKWMEELSIDQAVTDL